MVSGRVYQVTAVVANGIGSVSLGLFYVWPSYTLPLLSGSNATILSAPLTSTEEAMLGSLPSLGAVVGTACIGVLINFFGMKWASILASIMFVISWLMVGFTRSVTVVLIARFVGGIACGTLCVTTPVFISEVAEQSIRGALVSVIVIANSVGNLISYFIGWYCDYHAIVWINLAIAIVRVFVFLCVPESPVYLMKKKRVEEARIAMALYRGVTPNSVVVHQELTRIKQEISSSVCLDSINEKGEEAEKKMLTSEEYKTERKSMFATLITLCKSSASRRALLIVFVGFTMGAMMGISPVTVYTKQVFTEADPEKADLYSVILAVVTCVATVLSGSITDRVGRRVLLIWSSLLVAACLVVLAALLQTRTSPAWVLVLVIMFYVFCFMFGIGPIPYVLMTEMFSPEVQTLASIILVEWMWLNEFVVLAIFNGLNRLIGMHGTFYICAVNSLLTAAFCHLMVPETKGLSNQHIQLALLGKAWK